MTASHASTSAYPKVRRIKFSFGQPGPFERHFADNSIAFSHLIAGLSFAFPPGEEFFIRSVRRFSDEIADPVLKKRVAGFIGQEAVHGQQHNVLNEKLRELGYNDKSVDSFFKRVQRREERFDERHPLGTQRRRTRLFMLAVTAAAEHGTAVLAERVLTSPELQAIAGDPEVKHLLNWHALEEMEHKSVAFDVYRAVGGPEWLRILAMRLQTIAGGVPVLVLTTLLSILLTDPVGRRQPVRVLRETVRMVRGPLLKGLYGDMRQYMRRGFHPDDIDTSETLARWSEELFGSHGELVDHLK